MDTDYCGVTYFSHISYSISNSDRVLCTIQKLRVPYRPTVKRGVAGSGDGGRGSRTDRQHCSLLKDAASGRCGKWYKIGQL